MVSRFFCFFLLFLFTAFSAAELSSQSVDVSNYGSSTESKILASDDGREYRITITKPKDYNPNSSYSVLYYLDAWWLDEIVQGTHAIASLSDNIESLILVGISTSGDEMDWHVQRNDDYTPTPFSEKIMGIKMTGGLSEMDSSNTGGADVFIGFLESKVFPDVSKEHSNIKDRALLGHSFGGLFVAHVMQSNPDLFQKLLLISPSVWWNRSEILRDELFEEFGQRDSKPSIYIAVGAAELKMLKKPITTLDSILSDFYENNTSYKYEIFEGANHNSILPQAIYQGLVFMYGEGSEE